MIIREETLTEDEVNLLEKMVTEKLVDFYNTRDRLNAELKRIDSGWYGPKKGPGSSYEKEKVRAFTRNEDRIKMTLSIKKKMFGE